MPPLRPALISGSSGMGFALAQQLLGTTAHPIERIAEQDGFGSTLSLRQHFGKTFSITLSLYRREFRDREDAIAP